jgi:hypothetical protein
MSTLTPRQKHEEAEARWQARREAERKKPKWRSVRYFDGKHLIVEMYQSC